ncbi:MAG TPA: dihydroorotate dehydrogenase electron transfer subunit [Solirubrobacteraceae bacterium]|nr:dihydroorotate dehydrogenase electron transfer subunit [Solirubrobacteraceae bacterium]
MSHAPFGRRLLEVTGNDQLGAYRVLRALDPELARPGGSTPEPGQFAMIAAAEHWGGGEQQRPYLPRAFSIARLAGEECHFLLEDVGPGTRRLCELRAGDRLWVLGPLGRGFALEGKDLEQRRALLVGGGVGIAPLAILQDTLAHDTTVLLGFRDRARAAGAALLHDARVASDDGSVGHHGFVTELLAAELDRDPHAVVYACGPAAMLEGVRAMCEQHATPAQLALEAGMACGFGACFGCVVARRDGGYLRVCVDGPVVDAAELARVDEHAGAPA